jgi:hypothetical protein
MAGFCSTQPSCIQPGDNGGVWNSCDTPSGTQQWDMSPPIDSPGSHKFSVIAVRHKLKASLSCTYFEITPSGTVTNITKFPNDWPSSGVGSSSVAVNVGAGDFANIACDLPPNRQSELIGLSWD